jgi:outer membrane biosynthesis protein TonB
VSVKVWVGRFAIVEGQAQEEGPLLRSFPRQRPDEDEDELYVLVEPATPGSRQYCGQLVDAVGRMYQQDTLSITGAALRALRAAHRQLYDWNQRTLREQHVGAGLSSLAVRDRTAYLSLAGPSLAYHVGDGRFRRIAPEGPAAEPLGVTEWAEPTFDRYQLSPGDLLLIASPRIDELISQDDLRAILLKGGDEALVELFRAVRDQQEFALVLLACVVEPEGEALPAPAVPAPQAQPPQVVEGTPPTEEPVAAPVPIDAIGPPPSLEEDIQREQLLPEPVPSYSPPKVRLKGDEAGVTYRHPTGLGAALPRIPPLAIVAAIIIVIIGLVAWYIVPQALQQSKDDKFNSAVSTARKDLANALATQDVAQQRTLLQAAKNALDDAELARPNQVQVADLRSQIDTQLNKLSASLLLPDLEQVTDLSGRLPGPISPRDLAIGGGGAYFLDRQGGRVIAISLLGANPDPVPLFQAGDLIGDQIVGRPEQIAWAEGLQSLLVLDDANRLIAVAAGAPSRLLPVRDADTWGSADGIAYVGSDLYVMDRKGNQVWRYPPSENGFDSEREGVLSGFDLGQAVEMAAADGLYFLTTDNNVVHAGPAGTQPFSQAGIDVPLSSPGSVLPLPDLGLVLVADRGNSRIVEYGKDGSFKQQLVSPKFTDLRSIAVDEPNRLLYILVGGTLYRTPLPPLP